MLGALVEVGEHGVGDIGLQRSVDQVHKWFEGPEGIPEGERGHVGEAFGLSDGAVMFAEPAVGVLEYERVQHGAVDAGVEGLPEDFIAGVE